MNTGWLRPLVWTCLLAMVPALPAFAAAESVNGEVFTLGEVIVTSEEQVVNLATTVTEVSAEDIKQRGARNLEEALDLLPGVDVQKGSRRGDSSVQIRGFNDTDIKILVDGVPVYEQYSRQLDLAMIPTSAISKITVTKGASSVLYGANALGGVINIITKKAASKPTAAATVALGDYGTEEYSISAGAPVGKFNYWLGYTYRHSDGWRLSDDYDVDYWAAKYDSGGQDDGGKRDFSDYLQNSFNAKLGFDLNPDDSLYLSFDYQDNEKGAPNRRWYFPKWKQWHLNLVGTKKVTDWLKIKANAFYADHDDSLYLYNFDELSVFDNYSAGGNLQGFMDFGNWSYLKLGFSYQRDNSEQRAKSPIEGGTWGAWEKYEADTYTIALENESKPFDWLAFVVGASYDYYDPREAAGQPVPDSEDEISPQVGVVVTLSESTSLHGSVGKKIRFPQLKELYSDLRGGNPDLDPQKTTTYEIGLNQAIGDRVTLSAAGFYNDIKDLIDTIDVYDPVIDDDVATYVNIGKAVTKGVEVVLGADITENFWAGLNYTYMRTEDKEQHRELEGRPRHRVNLDLRYSFPFGLMASTQVSYTNRQFFEERVARRDYVWTRSSDFLLFNARVEQRLAELWGVEGSAFVEVSNITDRDYDEVGRPQPGRNFLAGLNFKY